MHLLVKIALFDMQKNSWNHSDTYGERGALQGAFCEGFGGKGVWWGVRKKHQSNKLLLI